MKQALRHIKVLTIAAVGATMALTGQQTKAALTSDVIFVVDESGSMSGEHGWLGTMVTQLDAALIAAGVTGNRFALTGYGGHVSGQVGHKHTVGAGDFGTAAELSLATGSLFVNGGTEDGWEAINFALDNYTFRAGAAVNVILVTDEDRDNINNAVTYASILAKLQAKGALLNAVVNGDFRTSLNATALGHDSDGNAFLEAPGGAFTTAAAGTAAGAGTTITDYYDLALATGGASWDLNQLRAGGNTAQSFTSAFVDIKVQEILETVTVPEPSTGLAGLILGGLVGLRRRRDTAGGRLAHAD